MVQTNLRPKQRARYVAIQDPIAVEGYVDERARTWVSTACGSSR